MLYHAHEHFVLSRTPIFICAFSSCHRLFPSRDRLIAHRKRDHSTEDGENHVITWNE
ncbi:hypothetical protein SCHPADRAFT_300589 [Schizopora paradoxa]|uniref:C2H2-type domain-containing protein n=1 Tax=Schizopora paradoxa TaxID=27342 RepID=A0A0H2RS29_9AGAM|nr:hypothetical protein SCHPADRAFT_300589 [Schizopora paradoxa]